MKQGDMFRVVIQLKRSVIIHMESIYIHLFWIYGWQKYQMYFVLQNFLIETRTMLDIRVLYPVEITIHTPREIHHLSCYVRNFIQFFFKLHFLT